VQDKSELRKRREGLRDPPDGIYRFLKVQTAVACGITAVVYLMFLSCHLF
jgi:hypothetical protein